MTKGGKDTLIPSSLKQKDNFHQTIENFGNFKYHDFCYTYYTSKDKINRHLKRVNEQSVDGPSAKRLDQSSVRCSILKKNISYVVSIVKLPWSQKPWPLGKESFILREFYAGELIMGKAIIASKRFHWKLVICLIADTFPFNLKTEAFLIG